MTSLVRIKTNPKNTSGLSIQPLRQFASCYTVVRFIVPQIFVFGRVITHCTNPMGNWGQFGGGNRPVRRGPCAFRVYCTRLPCYISIPYPPNCYSQTTRCFCIHASRLITRRCTSVRIRVRVRNTPPCNTCTRGTRSWRGACRRVIETLLIGFE